MATADIMNMNPNPNPNPNPDKAPPVQRRPVFSLLTILMGGLQWAYLAWTSLSASEKFAEKVVQEANIALFILGPLAWVLVLFGLFVIGVLFLAIALLRRERPTAWLWSAALALVSAPGAMWLLDTVS